MVESVHQLEQMTCIKEMQIKEITTKYKDATAKKKREHQIK